MATAQSIVNRSLRLLGQIEPGEDPTDDESDDALEALNAMLSSWRNERLMCYATQEESLTLANADASYTVGPGGDLDTDRPIDILAAWVVDNNISYAVQLITDDQYAAIQDKTTASDWPDRLNYRPTMATGTIYVYPVPNATRTLKLLTRVPLDSLALSDTISLPPGWEDALAFNLAIAIAPEYQTEPAPTVIRNARETKAAIKVVNSQPVNAVTELAAMFSGYRPNIESGV